MHRPWARFDDLRAGTALLCPPARRVLTAVRPDQVALSITDLRRAEQIAVVDSLREWRRSRLVAGQVAAAGARAPVGSSAGGGS
jgi:hypothetical protein